jgi:aromatic-L-amino-acid decarboxylase
LWFAIRTDGTAVFQELIRRHVAITQELALSVAADSRFEIVAPFTLNLLCLRLIGDSAEDGDRLTDSLIEAANATREVFFTRTVLNGRSVLRFSIGGRTTERHHVMAAWELLKNLS